MSKMAAVSQAVSDNPELRAKLLSATHPAERAEHLRDHGLEIPTHADINDHLSSLEDVDGGVGGVGVLVGAEVGGPVVLAAAIAAAI